MDDKFWYLKRCPLFEHLEEEEVRRLEADSQAAKFAKGSVVYMPDDAGESVFLLTSGRVKLYHLTGDGKQAVLAFIDPGEIFGELAVFEGSRREEFAEAMEATMLVRIPRSRIQFVMERHAEVALGVTKVMGFRRRRIERRLKSLLFRSNRERLVHLLLELAEQYGSRTPDGVLLKIKLSHQELANIIGSTRETVTVVLGELQSEGSLQIKRRQIFLKELELMAEGIGIVAPHVPVESPFTRPETRPASYGG